MADLNFGTVFPETEALLTAQAVMRHSTETASAIGDIRHILSEMTDESLTVLRGAARLLDTLAEETQIRRPGHVG